ncbi:trans-aconitate 2-methyltransferase [Pseudomonas xanthosomatis]|uniref:trans-aconitate 2-methyltransferase n=1 Tax=Pseudomonas xanthosomatis TaxID=2842356 RepID=UPI0035197689
MPAEDPRPIDHERLEAQASHLARVLVLPARQPNATTAIARLHTPIGPVLNNLFLLRIASVEYLGRRQPDAGGQLDSRLTPDMLLGPLLHARWDEHGWHCQYQPLVNQQREVVFRQALACASHRIHFPFPELDHQCREQIAPSSFWDTPQDIAEQLDRQEQHFRDASREALAGCLPDGAVIHDPACSTGAFIASLAKAFPASRCIGADRSSAMITHATANHQLPNLSFAVADAHAPAVPAGRCDVLILRFLNAEMMTRSAAIGLFEQLTGLLRPGGMALVFGQSSVLFEVGLQARQLSLQVIGSLANVPGTLQLFQFYRLVRPMPHLNEEHP